MQFKVKHHFSCITNDGANKIKHGIGHYKFEMPLTVWKYPQIKLKDYYGGIYLGILTIMNVLNESSEKNISICRI